MSTTTVMKVQAPPCPAWCASHTREEDGSFEHIGPTITLADFPDYESNTDTWTLELAVVQWERWDTTEGTIAREVPQVRIGVVEDKSALLWVNEARNARRLGEALILLADRVEGTR